MSKKIYDENGNEYTLTDEQFEQLQASILENSPEGTFNFDKGQVESILGVTLGE